MCFYENFILAGPLIDTGHTKVVNDLNWIDMSQNDIYNTDSKIISYVSTCSLDGSFKVWPSLCNDFKDYQPESCQKILVTTSKFKLSNLMS